MIKNRQVTIMAKRWRELTDEFDAISEDGQRFHVLVYTAMHDTHTMRDPNSPPCEGLKEARSTEGYHCNYIDDETFEIVKLGLRIKRID
jgi:hypothetical protein